MARKSAGSLRKLGFGGRRRLDWWFRSLSVVGAIYWRILGQIGDSRTQRQLTLGWDSIPTVHSNRAHGKWRLRPSLPGHVDPTWTRQEESDFSKPVAGPTAIRGRGIRQAYFYYWNILFIIRFQKENEISECLPGIHFPGLTPTSGC